MTAELDEKTREFLTFGTRTGKLAYTARDGRPLVAPIWFAIDDGDVVFNTGAGTAKGKALHRDPRAALCVDLEAPPFAFVLIQGSVQISEEPGELLRTATLIAERYVGADRAEEFGRRNGVPGELVVRLKADKVIADFDMMG